MRKLLLIFLFYAIPSYAQPVTPAFTTEPCHQQQIRQHKFKKQLRQQIISAILMNIQLQEQAFQQMAGLLQIRQMLQQQLTVKLTLIRG